MKRDVVEERVEEIDKIDEIDEIDDPDRMKGKSCNCKKEPEPEYKYECECEDEMGYGRKMLAHAYVLWQCYDEAFSPPEALKKGTLFPNLYGVYPIPK